MTAPSGGRRWRPYILGGLCLLLILAAGGLVWTRTQAGRHTMGVGIRSAQERGIISDPVAGGAGGRQGARFLPPRWARIILDPELFPEDRGFWAQVQAASQEHPPGDDVPAEALLSFSVSPNLPRQALLSGYGDPDATDDEDGLTWRRYGFLSFGIEPGAHVYTAVRAPREFYDAGFRALARENCPLD